MSILFFALWLLLNGRITGEILCFGVAVDALLLYFTLRFMGWSWKREARLCKMFPLWGYYFLNLIYEVAKASVLVLGVALKPSARRHPVLVEFRSGLNREYQNVILANSITLTPGTITVFQERDRFIVHALRKEYAEDLRNSSFVRILKKFP